MYVRSIICIQFLESDVVRKKAISFSDFWERSSSSTHQGRDFITPTNPFTRFAYIYVEYFQNVYDWSDSPDPYLLFHFKSAQINPRPPKWVGWFILFWFSKIWKDWLCCTCGSMAKPLGEAIPTRQKISSLRYMCSRSGKAEDLVRWKEGLLMDSIWMFFLVFFL